MNKLIIFLTLTIVCGVNAKIFRRCEFARELSKNGVARYLITNFVCLGESVSGLNSNKLTNRTALNADLGIFQIQSNANWCKFGKAGGRCGVKCENFLNDNIDDDIQCAKKIQEMEGFKSWSRWSAVCKNSGVDRLPNLVNCGH